MKGDHMLVHGYVVHGEHHAAPLTKLRDVVKAMLHGFQIDGPRLTFRKRFVVLLARLLFEEGEVIVYEIGGRIKSGGDFVPLAVIEKAADDTLLQKKRPLANLALLQEKGVFGYGDGMEMGSNLIGFGSGNRSKFDDEIL